MANRPSEHKARLLQENADLRVRLEEAEEALRAIRAAEVDALVMDGEVYSLKGSETPYRILIEALNEGAATLHLDGTVLYANQRLAELLRTPLESLIGSPLRRFVGSDYRSIFDALLDRSRQEPASGEVSFLCPDGFCVPVQLSLSGLNLDDARGVCLVATDLSEPKRVEAQLSHMVETLREEVARRARAEVALREQSLRLRELASELTMSEQRERRRLAEILHDGLQQLLVAAKFKTDLLRLKANTDLWQTCAELQNLLDESISCSRSLTGELSPPILYQGNLAAALKWLATWMQQKHALRILVEIEEDAEPESEEIKVFLFQSIRELLFNSVKHARANVAGVRLACTDNQLDVTIWDDGAGFQPESIDLESGGSGGFGLFSIRERLGLLGGWMEISSAPGHGSLFRLLVPRNLPEEKRMQATAPSVDNR